jgi:transformation/transcription domain-associated protein
MSDYSDTGLNCLIDIEKILNENPFSFVDKLVPGEKFLDITNNMSGVDLMDTGFDEKNARVLSDLLENQLNLKQYCLKIKIGDLIESLCELCHIINDLAHQVWIQLFIQMFNSLNLKQQQTLHGELTPFVSSGIHCIQKQCQLSVLNTFIESFALGTNLQVALFLKPSLLTYIAKNHNVWHRIILLLENSLYSDAYLNSEPSAQHAHNHHGANLSQQQQQNQGHSLVSDLIKQPLSIRTIQHETFNALAHLFSQLKEDDYRTGLWMKRSIHENTKLALCYEQQGKLNFIFC